MTTGFGKAQPQKASKSAVKRAKAAKQYEKMKSEGLPEYSIFIRVKDKKNWYPVGSLAVNRSSKVSQAIFENEEELRKGALRLFPILRKNQQQLEYGYKLKGAEFADEPIQLATPPKSGAGNVFQGALDSVKNTVSGLFKRS